MKAYLIYLWALPIALLWPVANLIIFAIRFGHLPATLISESLVFLPMGLVSALVLLFLLNKASNPGRKTSTIIGYIIASPVAFLGALMSGLILPPVMGTLIFGTIPLILGTVIGFAIGSIWKNNKQP